MRTTQTNKRKQDAQDQDRLFSLSSMTWSDVSRGCGVLAFAEADLVTMQSLKLQAQYDMKAAENSASK